LAKHVSARRYAQAVFEIALERQELDKWQSDLRDLRALTEDPGVVALLEDPRLRFEDKAKLLSGVFKDISPLALNLVYLLAARNRLGVLLELAGDYERMMDNYRGIERADVLTAVPTTDEDARKLETRLGSVLNKKVVVSPAVDPGLVGGIVARVGGKLLDASVRSRLEALKNEIGAAAR
jgi:F-type H+-transporting ATPase subunit delta